MVGGDLNSNEVLRSDFLRTSRANWRRSDFGDKFFAAGGRACDSRWRSVMFTVLNGCRVLNPYSDGVVCDDSAALRYPGSGIFPTTQFWDGAAAYQHAENIGFPVGNVLCPTMNAESIINPSVDGPLFNELVRFLRGL